nr:hypothetical protein [Chloroflexota bacterium]
MLEWIDVVVAVALALMLRFGIPLLITTVLVWALRRLDAHWQAEAEETWRMSLAAAAELRTPCWKTRQCSPEARAACPVYGRIDLPCWQLRRQATGRLPAACLDCVVFRNALVPQTA